MNQTDPTPEVDETEAPVAGRPSATGGDVMAEQLLSRRTIYAWLILLGTAGAAATTPSGLTELIGQCPFPVALIDLAARRMASMSPPMAEVLEIAPDESGGMDLRLLVENPELMNSLYDLVIRGALDAYQAHRSLRRGDGAVLEADAWLTVLPSDTRQWALLIIAPIGDDAGTYLPEPTATAWPVRATGLVIGTFDASWTVEQVSRDVEALWGWPVEQVVGSSCLDFLHRDDHTAFYLAVAQALTDRAAVGVEVRVRHRSEGWRAAHGVITPLAGDEVRFGFALSIVLSGNDTADRISRLERHMRRIAQEIEMVGLVSGFDVVPDADSLPGLADLSPRQWEILTRLLRGERVPGIAKELFLSQSTVRNHLSELFRKLGVHSQEELLALLRATIREQSRSGEGLRSEG